jgi:hypothetical protein
MSPNSLLSDADRAAAGNAKAPSKAAGSKGPKLVLAAVLLASAASVIILTRPKPAPVDDALTAKEKEADRILRENGLAPDQQQAQQPTQPVAPRGRGPQAAP